MESSTSRPNIILIVIDALRARNLGIYGKKDNPSPNIDQLAQHNSVIFKNAYSCWNTTDQSLTSIFSGKYPRSHGITNHGDKVTGEDLDQFDRTNTRLLAEILKARGYHTMAVDWMGRWFKRGFNYYGYKLKRNFTGKLKYYFWEIPKLYTRYMLGHIPILKCYTPMRKPSIKDLGKGIKDVLKTFLFSLDLAKLQDAGFVTKVATNLIKQPKNKPFFLFIHYWDTHTPYNCPRSFINREEKIKDSKDYLKKKYDGSVSYVDFQLGKLFEQLKAIKEWDNTLLIVTSDHGDSLTEHDIFFDHHGLYEETTHVPLILHYPGMFSESQTKSAFVQHVDLVPTIKEILGIEIDENQSDGQSLMPLIRNEKQQLRDFVFIEESYVQNKSAIRSDKYKYIRALNGEGWCNYCQKVHVGQEELYDLQKDPTEIHNIAEEDRKLADEMKKKLLDFIDFLEQKKQKASEISHDKKAPQDKDYDPKEEKLIRKRLKSLGYM